MCTLTLAWRVLADAPVVAASNRDESLDRPSEPPTRIETDPAVVAPRDADAGGTWTGYNEHGLYVGVTNRWIDADLTAARSRGLLVRDALRRSDAESAARFVERAVDAHEYDGFNLVAADADAAYLFKWDGRLRLYQLEPGVHVVVNVGAALGGGGRRAETFRVPPSREEAGGTQAANARRVRAALTPEPGERAGEWLSRAQTVLADHDYGVCVHGDGYGTRSSSLISIGEGGASYRFADGPPCRTDYRPVEGQL